ncbi:hypothetical protein GTP44_09375 [Duganella sp. FT50W]|uniref:PIN domain-containing protein n=1 Tax=Duganella lactea TaxID=2692173 RepID=A0A6L8MGJ1_9BURK|nr:type II toxin-antitoxin system VapC family toxin [Duganella lactea]MYM82160.1 hypothetical protein [Duganella lactea]
MEISGAERETPDRAIQTNRQPGVADALHHAAYINCDSMASFDDRKFARRVAALRLQPPVTVLR